MSKILAFAIAIAAVAAASAPAQAATGGQGIDLNGIMTGAAVNGHIVAIELPAATGEAE